MMWEKKGDSSNDNNIEVSQQKIKNRAKTHNMPTKSKAHKAPKSNNVIH